MVEEKNPKKFRALWRRVLVGGAALIGTPLRHPVIFFVSLSDKGALQNEA